MHDAQRSGITSEPLATNLAPAWSYPRVQKPAAAWADEAKRDYYLAPASQQPLKNRLGFDYANQVAVAGGRVYFGSSTEDAILCLDATTGEPQWTFFTDGPVRMAPTVDSGRVYAGSDDGSAYCLDANTGALIWKNTPAGTNNYLVPNNGRFVSPWAVRSGVVVDGGVAFFAAGIFPGEGVYACAVNALTGTRTAGNHWQQCLTNLGSLQGYALVSASRLYLPGSRSNPLFFDRATGAYQGQYTDKNAFGTFALLSGSDVFLGPAQRGGGAQITQASQSGGDAVATYAGNAVVVTTNRTFVLSDITLTALDRATRSTLWSRTVVYPYALILAGTTLVAGGDNEVAGFDSSTGNKLWSVPVRGRAYGLAVANGILFVSTDQGILHAFAQDQTAKQSSVIVF